MPNRRGPNTSHGFLSPNTRGWPDPIRNEVKHVYGAWRVKHPGEDHRTKSRGARIAWAAARRKYPKLYRDHVSREKQIERGTKIEHREHPEFSLSTARRIATDHVNEGKHEYDPKKYHIIHTPNLKVPNVKPAETIRGKKRQIRDLRQAAQEQRRWAKQADEEGRVEEKRAKSFKKHIEPIRAKVLMEDSILAKRFGKDRRKVANDLDMQAVRIQAQIRAEQMKG